MCRCKWEEVGDLLLERGWEEMSYLMGKDNCDWEEEKSRFFLWAIVCREKEM